MKLERIQLGFDWCEDLPYVINTIIREHEEWDYKLLPDVYNFQLMDWKCNKLLFPLYDYFYEHILSDEEYASTSNPKPVFYVYVMNNKRWEEKHMAFLYHDHKSTACVNGVFYLQTPTCAKSCPEDGALLVKETWDSPEVMIHPKAGELILMPGAYPHCPLGVETDDYRIAINIESAPRPR